MLLLQSTFNFTPTPRKLVWCWNRSCEFRVFINEYVHQLWHKAEIGEGVTSPSVSRSGQPVSLPDLIIRQRPIPQNATLSHTIPKNSRF